MFTGWTVQFGLGAQLLSETHPLSVSVSQTNFENLSQTRKCQQDLTFDMGEIFLFPFPGVTFMRPLLAFALSHTIVALDNGLGLTPAMGYNTVRTDTERAIRH